MGTSGHRCRSLSLPHTYTCTVVVSLNTHSKCSFACGFIPWLPLLVRCLSRLVAFQLSLCPTVHWTRLTERCQSHRHTWQESGTCREIKGPYSHRQQQKRRKRTETTEKMWMIVSTCSYNIGLVFNKAPCVAELLLWHTAELQFPSVIQPQPFISVLLLNRDGCPLQIVQQTALSHSFYSSTNAIFRWWSRYKTVCREQLHHTEEWCVFPFVHLFALVTKQVRNCICHELQENILRVIVNLRCINI